MAMKKADMEEHRALYHTSMALAQSAESDRFYRKAIEAALAALEYVDGMMQYERRYEDKEFETIDALEVILKYSPLLLDFESLDTLEGLLGSQKRIERNTSETLADRLAHARASMWEAHRMWDHLEQNPGLQESDLSRCLGSDEETCRSVAELWERMALLRRTPEGTSYRLELSTRLGAPVRAKCPVCGDVGEAPKAMFLEETRCPHCQKSVHFVLLSTPTPSNAKE